MSEDLIQQNIVWIDSDQALEDACAHWVTLPLLALDTEFIRSTTYYPIAGLIQVNDGEQNYLIDPLPINDWYPFLEVLDNDQITIAMHACSEDLEVLQMECGSVPAKILDTQLAAAFLGMPSSQGYGATVEAVLGVTLPKGETRSNWLQRPLSHPQRFYAALDVEYLFALAAKFQQQLERKNMLEWVLEEGLRVFKNYKQLQNINACHMRIKSAWKLSAEKLAVLVGIARWRENVAQQDDVPRNRVLKENTILDIAMRCPTHISKLRDIDGINERIIRKYGSELIAIIETQLALEKSELPEVLPGPLSKTQREQLQRLRGSFKPLAEQYDIAADVFLKKKEGETIIRLWAEQDEQAISSVLTGWRKTLLHDHVIQQLKTL